MELRGPFRSEQLKGDLDVPQPGLAERQFIAASVLTERGKAIAVIKPLKEELAEDPCGPQKVLPSARNA